MTTSDTYLDYDAAIERVTAAAVDLGLPIWLLNPSAVLTVTGYTPHQGYTLDEALLTDRAYMSQFLGVDLMTQAQLGAAKVTAEDPTNGRRSHVVSITEDADRMVTVTFSTGSTVTAGPAPTGTSVVWSSSTTTDQSARRFGWVGHDRFTTLITDIAQRLRKRTVPFNPSWWLTNDYRARNGGQNVGPVAAGLADSAVEPGLHPTLPGSGLAAEGEKFNQRLLHEVQTHAARWAAAEGVELTLTATHGPFQRDPLVAAPLARITITCTGDPTTADGWTIHYHDTLPAQPSHLQ